ncbi:type VI secretion system baseplate subunit TssF [Klebsiella pneumoniae subsp. pneumoniae]|nr:type VI secretion system baseplate subunit TssF [Klebsiella pneumoniae subsp. pneumoniae]
MTRRILLSYPGAPWPSGLYNTWLIVGGEAFDNHTVPEDESLSLTLTGTNGQLPRRACRAPCSIR